MDSEVLMVVPAPQQRAGIVSRLDPERRFGYVETTGPEGRRCFIFVAGKTASHRTVGRLRVGSRVVVCVVDEWRICDLCLAAS